MDEVRERFNKAITAITARTNLKPTTLIILGSGLGEIVGSMDRRTDIPYSEIPHFRSGTVSGHKGLLSIGCIAETPVYCMQGRNHYYEGCTDEDMRFPIQLFALLGVKNLIITNACGSMNENIRPGEMTLITDHLNMTGRNPLVGRNFDEIGERFCDMSEPYDTELRNLAETVATNAKINIKKGIYVGYLGPSYETKAEIKAYRNMGGDVIGMSTVPETIVARHAGIRVLGIACVTNMATGISESKLSHEEVLDRGQKIAKDLIMLLEGILEKL